jgi:hypothetical protein
MAPLYAKFVSQPAEALAKDAQAMAIGERLYRQQLRRLPWRRRTRQQGLSEPDRPRLAGR